MKVRALRVKGRAKLRIQHVRGLAKLHIVHVQAKAIQPHLTIALRTISGIHIITVLQVLNMEIMLANIIKIYKKPSLILNKD